MDHAQHETKDPVNVLYIAGIGRSGSTLLCRTMGLEEGIYPVGEVMRLFRRGMVHNELCSCGDPAQKCSYWGEVIRNFQKRTGLKDAEDVEKACHRITEGHAVPLVFTPWLPTGVRRRIRAFRDIIHHLYCAVASVSGASTLVDASKNPAWARLLLDVPGVRLRIVHLVRDSRGVAHSFEKLRKRTGARESNEYMDRYHVLTTSFLWILDNLLTEYVGARADCYCRVRYRDFVRAPRETVRAILRNGDKGTGSFGDRAMPRDAEPLQPHCHQDWVDLGNQHLLAGNPVRFATGRITLCEDIEWRHHMSQHKKTVVTAITAPLLLRYGILRDGHMHHGGGNMD